MQPMVIPTLIMATLALVLLGYGYQTGSHIKGMQNTFAMTVRVLPLLICAFTVAGMMQEIVSPEGIARWVGPESGLKGIFMGAFAGALTPGGPFISLPIAAGFLHSGAGIGTMVAFITSWSIWAVMRLPMEVGILGWKFTAVRLLSSAVLPILAGLIAKTFFSWVRIT